MQDAGERNSDQEHCVKKETTLSGRMKGKSSSLFHSLYGKRFEEGKQKDDKNWITKFV